MTAHFFNNALSIKPTNFANLPQSANTVLLFNANTLNVADYDLPRLLSELELSVINRRKNPTAKQEYLASRLLLKMLVKTTFPEFANVALNAITTNFNHTTAKLELHINDCVINTCISHSHGFVGVALNSKNNTFGFDLEKISLTRPFEKLAKHFYHSDEVTLITSQPNTQSQANTFFRIWTLKESLAKATSRPIAKLLSPNVFTELAVANLASSSQVVSTQTEAFDLTLVHKKSTDWRCFLLTDKSLTI
jgi:4'-phosphopantetheinyl transferase